MLRRKSAFMAPTRNCAIVSTHNCMPCEPQHIARSEIASTRDLSVTGFDEKRIRLFVKRLPPIFEHDPEEWSPVFGKDHVQTKDQTFGL